jgi:serine/threonine protein kinase
MNTRLTHRFSENEILEIFTQISSALVKIHGLIHRDIKVNNKILTDKAENILLVPKKSSGFDFKLGDFGSATTTSYTSMSMSDIRALDIEVETFTTEAYRPPELLDLFQKRPITNKVPDISKQ